MTKKEANLLASRFRALRPTAFFENAERRVWADMVNAVTATSIPETLVREFRAMAGWEPEIDRTPDPRGAARDV